MAISGSIARVTKNWTNELAPMSMTIRHPSPFTGTTAPPVNGRQTIDILCSRCLRRKDDSEEVNPIEDVRPASTRPLPTFAELTFAHRLARRKCTEGEPACVM
jgi:hypothetical protein